MTATFDRTIFGQVDLNAPALDDSGCPYWVDDHNQPLSWADAFDLWQYQATHPWTPPTGSPRDPGPDGQPPFETTTQNTTKHGKR